MIKNMIIRKNTPKSVIEFNYGGFNYIIKPFY